MARLLLWSAASFGDSCHLKFGPPRRRCFVFGCCVVVVVSEGEKARRSLEGGRGADIIGISIWGTCCDTHRHDDKRKLSSRFFELLFSLHRYLLRYVCTIPYSYVLLRIFTVYFLMRTSCNGEAQQTGLPFLGLRMIRVVHVLSTEI